MSAGCSGKCPGCKKRQEEESRTSSLIQLVADKLKGGSESSEAAVESSARGLMVAEILAHATSFVV
ncbi:hypothetical protein SAMN05421819_1351 [Bryocella elongata]|uniref:Uncharacterized protein n=1 Tax=Bryocella elongata TaxID=863522 RepID=A0A1H5VXD8_9BACT|nr:hypothetical protein SAMN05421819_1351 [Bryocella elongata]